MPKKKKKERNGIKEKFFTPTPEFNLETYKC